MVPTKNLLDLLSEVEYPLGLLNTPDQPPMTDAVLKKRIERMLLEKKPNGSFVLPVLHHPPFGEANFHEFLSALVNRAMGDTGDAAEVTGVKDAMEDTIRKRTTKTYVNNVRSITPKKQRKSKQDIAKHLNSLRKVYVGSVCGKRIQIITVNLKAIEGVSTSEELAISGWTQASIAQPTQKTIK